MAQELLDQAAQYGLAIAVALYLLRWTTMTLTEKLKKITEALDAVARALDRIDERMTRMEEVQRVLASKAIRCGDPQEDRG